jgi:4'-phosphopantetheinyl transferase
MCAYELELVVRYTNHKAHVPQERKIDLWRTFIGDHAGVVNRYVRLLSPEERARNRRYKDVAHSRCFVISRAILRLLIADRTGCPPEQILFDVERNGKPTLRYPAAQISFNVSHSNELIVYAISGGGVFGIDVEKIAPIEDCDGIVRRFFARVEREELALAPPDELLRWFYCCWVRKEAHLKATGVGLSGGLDKFAVSINPRQPARFLDLQTEPDGPSGWRLHHLEPAQGYVGALSMAGDEFSMSDWNDIGRA